MVVLALLLLGAAILGGWFLLVALVGRSSFPRRERLPLRSGGSPTCGPTRLAASPSWAASPTRRSTPAHVAAEQGRLTPWTP